MTCTPLNDHSPLPFELDFLNWQIKDKTGNIIAQLDSNFNLIEDSSFIMKACNSYYKLQRDNAALIEALNSPFLTKTAMFKVVNLISFEESVGNHSLSSALILLVDRHDTARAAIAAAGGVE